MFSSSNRKGQWSRSIFGSRPTKNIAVYEDPARTSEQRRTDTPLLEKNSSKRKRLSSESTAKPKANRSNSKRRLLFGKRRSLDGILSWLIYIPPSDIITDTQIHNIEPVLAKVRESALATVPETATLGPAPLTEAHVNARSNLTHLQTPQGRRVDTPINFSPSPTQAGSTVLLNTLPCVQGPSIVQLEIPRKGREPSGLRHVQSATSLAHQLSHKISSTFGNPTVIHRPRRDRPALQFMHTSPPLITGNQQSHQNDSDLRPRDQSNTQSAAVGHQQGLQSDSKAIPAHQPNSQIVSDPSSYTNSGSSPEETSTEKTSAESPASVGSARHRDSLKLAFARMGRTAVQDDPQHADVAHFISQPPPVTINPTMLTVELAASAKMFFEMHFNSLFSGEHTPRELRRMELEAMLQSGHFTEEEKQVQRSAWFKQESANLRLSRAQKSKSRPRAANGSGATVAGYEVVRILGKGSFGVVRLVREQGHGSSESDTADHIRHSSSFPREEILNLRKAAVDAVRRTRESWSGSPPISPRPSSPRIPKSKKEVFAMKVIRKSDMLKNSQESHLRAERDFLVASEKSRWVVPLVAAFQDQTNLYLVMEYMIGGDFLGLLIRYERLKEKVSKWYVAEMILCIEEAHRLQWIHRDVKPDNFLISSSGHLKISDFGLAFDGHWSHDKTYFNNHRYSLMEKLGIKVQGDSEDRKESSKVADTLAKVMHPRKSKRSIEMERHQVPNQPSSTIGGIFKWRDQHGRRKLAESTVGTSQYMAPEVIRGEQYDGRCDWWSIGIILYEVRPRTVFTFPTHLDHVLVFSCHTHHKLTSMKCLYGHTPFLDEDRTATKLRILVSIPSYCYHSCTSGIVSSTTCSRLSRSIIKSSTFHAMPPMAADTVSPKKPNI